MTETVIGIQVQLAGFISSLALKIDFYKTQTEMIHICWLSSVQPNTIVSGKSANCYGTIDSYDPTQMPSKHNIINIKRDWPEMATEPFSLTQHDLPSAKFPTRHDLPITGEILTWPDRLMVMPKVQFSKYIMLRVVKFIFKNVMYGKIKHCEMDVVRMS